MNDSYTGEKFDKVVRTIHFAQNCLSLNTSN